MKRPFGVRDRGFLGIKPVAKPIGNQDRWNAGNRLRLFIKYLSLLVGIAITRIFKTQCEEFEKSKVVLAASAQGIRHSVPSASPLQNPKISEQLIVPRTGPRLNHRCE